MTKNTIVDWITGLMRENTDALGFIPSTTIQGRYITKNRYIIQTNERGQKVGYLLHGALSYGQPVVISQACIQSEKRLKGYGEMAFLELLNRAKKAGSSNIYLGVADNLSSAEFWQHLGFEIIAVRPGGEARNRMIYKMVYRLALPLFEQPPPLAAAERSE